MRLRFSLRCILLNGTLYLLKILALILIRVMSRVWSYTLQHL